MRQKLINNMAMIILINKIIFLIFLIVKGTDTAGILLFLINLCNFLLAAFTDTSSIFLAVISIFVGIMSAILLPGFMMVMGIIYVVLGVLSILIILN